MENASKALIIAGAILLAILLISLGIMIFNQAQDTVSGSGMDQAAVTTFNNQLIKYEGNIKGTMVKSMIQEVLAINAEAGNNDGIKVTVQLGSGSDTTKAEKPSTSTIINNNTYNVKMEYGSNNRINNIVVTGTFSSTGTGGTGG